MKNYAVIEEESGIKPKIIKEVKKWRSYKKGEVQIFSSFDEAYDFSKLTEKFIVNQEEYDLGKKEYGTWLQKVRQNWINELRAEYDYLSDPVFNLCLSQAEEKGRSVGYDEIAMYMDEIVDFVDSIIKALERK